MMTHLTTGFVLGWVGSMPIAGAVSIFVFKRGLAGRLKAGLTLSVGAAVAEAALCLVALLGTEKILATWPAAENVARIAGAVFLLSLGTLFVVRKRPIPAPDANGIIQENLLREFWLGFSLVAGNISVPINWLAILTVAVGLGFQPHAGSPLLFALGVALGILGWFSLLLNFVGAFRTRLSHSRIQWIMRGMGLLLILTGLARLFLMK